MHHPFFTEGNGDNGGWIYRGVLCEVNHRGTETQRSISPLILSAFVSLWLTLHVPKDSLEETEPIQELHEGREAS